MPGKVTFIDYQEPYSSRVARLLTSHGFRVTDEKGVACADPPNNTIGVLIDYPEEASRRIFGLLKRRRQPGVPLGEIAIHEDRVRKRLVGVTFRVYGRQHVVIARELANEIATTLDTDVSLTLESEEPRGEGH